MIHIKAFTTAVSNNRQVFRSPPSCSTTSYSTTSCSTTSCSTTGYSTTGYSTTGYSPTSYSTTGYSPTSFSPLTKVLHILTVSDSSNIFLPNVLSLSRSAQPCSTQPCSTQPCLYLHLNSGCISSDISSYISRYISRSIGDILVGALFRILRRLGPGLVGLMLAAGSTAEALTCDACHPAQKNNLGFKHAAKQLSCQQCHGDSIEHLKDPRQAPSLPFSADRFQGDQQNQICLNCHTDSARLGWSFSAHALADVQCTDCHQLHQPADEVMQPQTQTKICAGCHQDIKAQLNYPHRHPVLEGQVACSDCHAAHDNAAAHGLKTTNPTDTCIACHPETRGPFLFEHDPVTEDCGLCHQPHGSTIESLLVARSPFLCQQCHMASGHSSRLNDGTALAATSSNLLARGCSNCHSQVHGSNHPAGARLTR